jgi:hypothetical protein
MTASAFETMLHVIDTPIDSVMAELFDYQPMKERRNATAIVDPLRSPLTDIVAIIDTRALELQAGDRSGPERLTASPYISVQDVMIPSGIQRLDRFIRKKTGQVYEVAEPKPDGLGRTLCIIREIETP